MTVFIPSWIIQSQFMVKSIVLLSKSQNVLYQILVKLLLKLLAILRWKEESYSLESLTQLLQKEWCFDMLENGLCFEFAKLALVFFFYFMVYWTLISHSWLCISGIPNTGLFFLACMCVSRRLSGGEVGGFYAFILLFSYTSQGELHLLFTL